MPRNIYRYYGFTHPPVGLMSVLDQVPMGGLFHIIDPIGTTVPYHEIQAGHWVIITTHEPASHVWFDRLIANLLHERGLPPSRVILHSACLWDPGSPIPHVANPVDEITDFLGRFDVGIAPRVQPNRHFVCLNRLPRWQRLALVQGLIDRDLLRYGAVSHGAVPGDDRFPLRVDFDQPSYDDGYNLDSDLITAPAINVITESCYEPRAGLDGYESHPRPGLTEKTYKSIIAAQLPIFLASYRTVSCYRELGFDAFDDIIDHGYDLEPDPEIRVRRVVDEIARQCGHELEHYRERLHARFQANLDRLRSFRGNYQRELADWRRLLSHGQ